MNDGAQAARRFADDGFVIVRRLLNPELLREVEAEIVRYVAEVAPTIPPERVIFEPGRGKLINHLSAIDQFDEYWRKLQRHEEILDVVRVCIGTEVEPTNAKIFNKAPGKGTPTPPHQDNAFFCYEPADGLQAWIALDVADRESGCLWYARGSHRSGDLPHKVGVQPPFSKELAEGWDEKVYPSVPAELQPGDAVFHHIRTIHWTESNRSDHNRRGLVMDYRGVNARVDEAKRAAHEKTAREVIAKHQGSESG